MRDHSYHRHSTKCLPPTCIPGRLSAQDRRDPRHSREHSDVEDAVVEPLDSAQIGQCSVASVASRCLRTSFEARSMANSKALSAL
jgi:hypothetical protein